MKVKLLLAGCMIGMALTGYSQRPPMNPQLKEMLEQKDSSVLHEKIASLEKGDKEEDLQLLISYYNSKRDTAKSRITSQLLKQKFPNGTAAFNELGERIYNERDPEVNEKNYKEMMARFGAEPRFARQIDGSRYFVAVTFLGKNKPQKVMEYLNMIRDTAYKTNAFSYAAREAIGAKEYKLGETLIRKTFADLARRGETNPRGYDEFARIFSELLYHNGKYAEGFPYAKEVYEKKSTTTSVSFPELKTTYLNYLVKMNKLKEAYPLMEEQMRNGAASRLVKDKFKKAYVEVNGSDAGYSALVSRINDALKEKIKAELSKKMLNTPAYNFTLKDLKGQTVSLNDYKGKVVILDFWATWCGPCKASFPMMQAAVTKFKSDPGVVFLFIHTMETSADAAKNAADYIKDKKYTFNVLMDLKDPVTKSNPAAAGYKVAGIPAKFIIDGSGNIRFSSLGHKADGEDAFLEEMAMMIEMARENKG